MITCIGLMDDLTMETQGLLKHEKCSGGNTGGGVRGARVPPIECPGPCWDPMLNTTYITNGWPHD